MRACTRQPVGLQLNPAHWLAPNVAFVKVGTTALVYGAPAIPVNGFASVVMASGGQPTAAQGFGLRGNGSRYESYAVPGFGGSNPHTFMAWTNRINADMFSFVVLGAGNNGANRGGTGLGFAGSWNDKAFAVSGNADGARGVLSTSSNWGWSHIASTHPSTGNKVYVNGGDEQVDDFSRIGSPGGYVDLLRDNLDNSIAYATSDCDFLAFPIAVNRVLSAAEIARFYAEQLVNPWSLFQERTPLFTGMGSGAWTPIEVTG